PEEVKIETPARCESSPATMPAASSCPPMEPDQPSAEGVTWQRPSVEVDNGFESDDPSTPFEIPTSGSSSSSGSGGGSGQSTPPSTAPPGVGTRPSDAARAIEEADIVKLEGRLLFALSRYGGLSVVDASNRDNLRLVGRHRTRGVPFEMYVRDQRGY